MAVFHERMAHEAQLHGPAHLHRKGVRYAAGYCGSGVVWARGAGVLPSALSRERRSARDLSKEIARLCSCSRVRPMLSGFNSEEAQCAAGDEVTLEVEGVVDG
jgi:hypothetical protein